MYMATGKPQTPRAPRKFRWTSAMLERLPNDGNRYEALDGELLVTPAPEFRHQRIATKLVAAFERYFEVAGRGIVVGPGAVVFGKNELQPDVQIIARLDRDAPNAHWRDLPLPSLVIEVLSPGSHRHDLVKKRDAYLRIGIPEYWVVDPDERCVLVFRQGSEADGPTRVVITLHWRSWAEVAPLEIDVARLFPG